MSSIILELTRRDAYIDGHGQGAASPNRDQIDLSAVLEALSEPTRREIVLRLLEQGEAACQAFDDSRQDQSQLPLGAAARSRRHPHPHRRALRMISVRVDDLAARFPGLLDAIVAAARAGKAAQEGVGAVGSR